MRARLMKKYLKSTRHRGKFYPDEGPGASRRKDLNRRALLEWHKRAVRRGEMEPRLTQAELAAFHARVNEILKRGDK